MFKFIIDPTSQIFFPTFWKVESFEKFYLSNLTKLKIFERKLLFIIENLNKLLRILSKSVLISREISGIFYVKSRENNMKFGENNEDIEEKKQGIFSLFNKYKITFG